MRINSLPLPHEAFEIFFPFVAWDRSWWFNLLGLLFLFVFWDRRRFTSWRNLDLVVMCAWIPLGDYELGPDVLFSAVSFLPLLYLWARMLWLIRHPPPAAPAPNLGPATLDWLSVAFLIYSLLLCVVCPYPFATVDRWYTSVSESSYAALLGVEQILQGRPPYGNVEEFAAIYGPAFYAAFLPAGWAVGTDDIRYGYVLAARLTVAVFLFVSFLGARELGNRVGGPHWRSALGFAWVGLPYFHHAAYWSWGGNLLPATWALLGLVALVSVRNAALFSGLAAGLAAATSYLPVLWIPIWFWAHRSSALRVRFVFVAGLTLCVFFALAMAQPSGPMAFLNDVSSYVNPDSAVPDWRLRWSPSVHFPWVGVLRQMAILSVVPTGLWVWWVAWRRGSRGVVPIHEIAALCGLLVVHGQMIKLHAPGRMTLWALPFFLVVIVMGGQRRPESQEAPAISR